MRKGFTLIELMVVIAVIGILAAVALVSLTGLQKSARDATRQSNLSDYDTALKRIYQDNNPNTYPANAVANTADTTIPTPGANTIFGTNSPLVTGNYMGKVLTDPQNNQSGCNISTGNCAYKYLSTNANQGYIIWAGMESTSNAFFINSNGNRGKESAGDCSTVANCP